jgi:arylsulfatase A
MNRILPAPTLGVGLALALLGQSCNLSDHKSREKSKPNIILIMADDIGYEAFGCYGGTSFKTPFLDTLATQGIRFTHAYSQPLCTPTRVQLMTGKYNFRNWKAFGILDPAEETFGHLLKSAGYKTCIAGKWQLYSYNPPEFEPEFRGTGMKPENSGFDEWYLWHAEHTENKGSRYANPVIMNNGVLEENTRGKYGPDLFANYITGFMERNKDVPFFIYYPMVLPHPPFDPTPDSDDWNPSQPIKRSPAKYYAEMVSYTDKIAGSIVGTVNKLGIRNKTIIIFYSDNGSYPGAITVCNGEEVIGGKGLPTDAGTHVPLIVSWPGTAPEGAVNEDLISSVDFYATLAELAGISPDVESYHDGISFACLLKNEKGAPRESMICWHDPRPGWDKEKFTSLALWARDKRYKLYDDGRFYDIQNDVLEQHDISGEPASESANISRTKLRQLLDEIPKDKREPEWNPYNQFKDIK